LKIAEYLHEQLMFLDMPSRTKTEAMKFLAKKFCAYYDLHCQEELSSSILEREKIESTGLGRGLAVPHGRTELVDKLYVVFGRSAAGLDWQASDGQLAHYIFLVIGPSRLINEYLDILSQIGKVAMRQSVREVLLKARKPVEIIEAVRGSGVRHHKR